MTLDMLVKMDNRGLEPPEPLLRILEAVEMLEPQSSIEALMDRRPVFLFPELDERGLRYTCDPRAEGGFILRIDKV